MEGKKSCGTCSHCEHKDIHSGLCRINPPTVLLAGTPKGPALCNSQWPAVHLDNDYCDNGYEKGNMVHVMEAVPKHLPLS